MSLVDASCMSNLSASKGGTSEEPILTTRVQLFGHEAGSRIGIVLVAFIAIIAWMGFVIIAALRILIAVVAIIICMVFLLFIDFIVFMVFFALFATHYQGERSFSWPSG